MADTPIVKAAAPKAASTPAPAAPATPATPAAPVTPAPQAPAQEPQAPVAQAASATPEPSMSDRTAGQVEKLLESNQQLFKANELLRQELQRRATSNQQFAPIQAPVAQQQHVPQQPMAPMGQQQQPMPQPADFIEIDPTSGERFINQAKFEQAYTNIQRQATQAQEVVQNYIRTAEQREVERQDREAFSAYPELNPASTNFDAKFNQLARAALVDSMMNPSDYGGRPLGFREAADWIKGTITPRQIAQTPVQPQIDPAVLAQNQTAKEQASLAAQPQPQQGQADFDQERAYQNLVQGTRLGSDEALARRLLNAPHKIEDIEAALAER